MSWGNVATGAVPALSGHRPGGLSADAWSDLPHDAHRAADG
jgi:hypothetical protein